jgi:NADH-quinone oxidoreductase subunit A
VYECGEPTIGSSFVQFDLRFYVVALLFIIFDVEVAFFFPWAAVFGKATQLAGEPPVAAASSADPAASAELVSTAAATRLREMGLRDVRPTNSDEMGGVRQSARNLALASFADIGVFFGVLLVGFAYVWRRGDLDWVRAVTRQKPEPIHRAPPPRAVEPSQSILSA